MIFSRLFFFEFCWLNGWVFPAVFFDEWIIFFPGIFLWTLLIKWMSFAGCIFWRMNDLFPGIFLWTLLIKWMSFSSCIFWRMNDLFPRGFFFELVIKWRSFAGSIFRRINDLFPGIFLWTCWLNEWVLPAVFFEKWIIFPGYLFLNFVD